MALSDHGFVRMAEMEAVGIEISTALVIMRPAKAAEIPTHRERSLAAGEAAICSALGRMLIIVGSGERAD